MDDDILREIREYRDAYAARFNYDVEAMFRDLRERTRASGRRVVSFAKPSPGLAPEVDAKAVPADDASEIGVRGPAAPR
jgi:hypothetical protein